METGARKGSKTRFFFEVRTLPVTIRQSPLTPAPPPATYLTIVGHESILRLLRETDRMKQVWRRQQIERRAEAGLRKWWEVEDDDAAAEAGQNGSSVGGGGGRQGRGATSVGGNGGGAASGVLVEVRGKRVPIEALTPEEAAEMSPAEYIKFYNLAAARR